LAGWLAGFPGISRFAFVTSRLKKSPRIGAVCLPASKHLTPTPLSFYTHLSYPSDIMGEKQIIETREGFLFFLIFIFFPFKAGFWKARGTNIMLSKVPSRYITVILAGFLPNFKNRVLFVCYVYVKD
jgi:hypothetical protein